MRKSHNLHDLNRAYMRWKYRMIRKQRLMGIGMLIISLVMVILALTGKTFLDKDITAVVFLTVPLGLWLVLSKEVLIV